MREVTSILRQTTITLPHYDYEVRALYIADCEAPYLPVQDLCNMLGLRASTHIPRWRKLVLWGNARKLPVATQKGKRLMWCLHMGALLSWYCTFSWDNVLPERRAQLRESADAWLDASKQAHQEMLARYRTTRRLLFEILTAYAESDTTFSRFTSLLHKQLNDVKIEAQWVALIARGKDLINRVATHARQMLHEQSRIPLMDVLTLNTVGEIIDEFPLPLFPIVQEKELGRLFTYLGELIEWHQQLKQFLADHGIWWDDDRKIWDSSR